MTIRMCPGDTNGRVTMGKLIELFPSSLEILKKKIG